MESLTWNKTDTDAVYAYMQEQERPAYMDTVRSVTAENGVPYLRFSMLESESCFLHGFLTRKGGVRTGILVSMYMSFYVEDNITIAYEICKTWIFNTKRRCQHRYLRKHESDF